MVPEAPSSPCGVRPGHLALSPWHWPLVSDLLACPWEGRRAYSVVAMIARWRVTLD